MTDIFHAEANAPVEMAIAPEAPRPVSVDWAMPAVAEDGKRDRADRRAAISKAVAARRGEDAPPERKGAISDRRAAIHRAAEKVAARGDAPLRRGDGQFTKTMRDTGSESERASTRGSVAKAMEKVGQVASREETLSGRDEMRKAVETLRQRYPLSKPSAFVRIAKEWDADFKKDPVGTRDKMLELYAKASPDNFRPFEEPEKERGARGSVRQAMRDHADMSDLAEFEKEFGGRLPAVLSELVRHDTAMVNDPAGTSARLAANYGAPVTERQAVAYEQRQHQERARQQDAANVHRALDLIVQHKVLPHMDDEATLNAIATKLAEKTFKRTGDRLADLKAAHAAVMADRANATSADKGSRSITGGPSPGRAAKDPPGVRGAVARAIRRA